MQTVGLVQEKCQSVAEFLMEHYRDNEKMARDSSTTLLTEGLFSYKNQREANFVQIRVYNMFMLMRYLDNERRDETTSKGSNFDGSSDLIVQVEEYFFIPAIKLILNEQNPAKPFLLFKYKTRKFEIYSVQNQGRISTLWESLRRRCILYVSPSKVPSSSECLKLEVQRADKSEVKHLSRFIFDFLCFPGLRNALPKMNFIFETPNLTGITFKGSEVVQSAKESLISKSLPLKDALLGCLRLLEGLEASGYWLKLVDLDAFGVAKHGKLVVNELAALVRQPKSSLSGLINETKDFMADASLLSKADLDLIQRLSLAQQKDASIASLISQI